MIKVKGKLLFYVEVLAVVASFFLAGPSFAAPKRMYTGPERPATETALIRGASSEINIESCDGSKVTSLEIMVLPGEHTIEMSFSGGMEVSIENSFLQFTAEAGHTYVVDREDVFSSPGARYHAFIFDKTTGKRVSKNITPESMLKQRLIFIEKAIQGHPQHVDFWAEKIILLARLGRYEEALPAVETAISLKPNTGELWMLKSAVLYQLKRYNDALTAIDRAIQLLPNEAQLRKMRQDIIKAMGT